MANYTNNSYEANTYTSYQTHQNSLPLIYPAIKAANKRTEYKCRGTCSAYGLCSCGRN